MSLHIDMPDEPRGESADDWRARWNERLRQAGALGDEDAPVSDRPDAGEQGAIPSEPTVEQGEPDVDPPVVEQDPAPAPSELPSFNVDAPQAIEARRRVEDDVERARAEMEALVRQAAALEMAEAGTPEPALEPQPPAASAIGSQQMAEAEQALRRLSETIAAAEAATARAAEAATRADAATERALAAMERADAATTRAEQIAERAAEVSREAERAVDAAEAKLGEILDALLLDLRQIGDRISE